MQAPIKTEAEFDTVFARTETMDRPAMYRLMLLLTKKLGLRPLEIGGLDSRWFQGKELRIPLGYSKRKAGRTLIVDAEILEALALHMQGRVGRVFLNRMGEPFSAKGISDAMQRLYREAGVKGCAYSGRRTLATNLVDRGVNILVLQRILGHASPVTTMEYVGVTPAMMERALFAA